MVFTKNFKFPTDEELNVEEVPVACPVLMATSFHMGKYCEPIFHEFMLCKAESNDPRYCLNEGKIVTKCALEFLRKVKKSCQKEIHDYAYCIERSSRDYSYNRCRSTQSYVDNCMLEHLNLERPSFGYFAKIKIHESQREKPERFGVKQFSDVPIGLPEDYPRYPAKYGQRKNSVPS